MLAEASSLRGQGMTWRAIGERLGMNPSTLRGQAHRERKTISKPIPRDPLGAIHIPAIQVETGTDQKRIAFQQFLETSTCIPDQTRTPSPTRKVMVIADLHGSPSKDILLSAVHEQPDLLIVAGDLLDGRESSPHAEAPNMLKRTIRDEMQTVRAYLEQILISTKADLMIMRGNHDNWPAKRAAEALAAYPDVLAFWRDPLDLLVEQLPLSRVKMVNTIWRYHFPDKSAVELGESQYMCILGDALISHANFVGSNAGDAVRKLSLWLNKWRGTLGLPDMALLVQAHVHKICMLEQDSGHQVLVEPGAAFEPCVEGYKVEYQAKWSPGSVGALVFEQYQRADNWRTDLSSVRLIRPRRSIDLLPMQNRPVFSY